MSTYPAIYSGQHVTAQLLSDMQPLTIMATTDQTVTNTATVQNDTTLTAPVSAGASYLVEIYILASSSSDTLNQGFKTRWSIPTGSSGERARFGSPNIAGNYTSRVNTNLQAAARDTGTDTTYLMTGDNGAHAFFESAVVLIGPNSGNVVFQFAQATAGGAGTSVARKAGSFMRVQRIA